MIITTRRPRRILGALACGLIAAASHASTYTIADAHWQLVRDRYTTQSTGPMTEAQIDAWRPYAIATDANGNTLPSLASHSLTAQTGLALGYVDVTQAPFLATPDNPSDDDTAKIQDAILFARAHRLAVYLPAGDYHVSDTIHLPQGMPFAVSGDRIGSIRTGDQHPCILIGSRTDLSRRARIVLKDGSAGFGNPTAPKILLYAHRPRDPLATNTPLGEQNPDHYNQFVGSLDLRLGANPGAVGLRMQGAEGCAVQDVNIDATGAYIGFLGLPGSGGSSANISVTGGQIGVALRRWEPGSAPGLGTLNLSATGSQPGVTLSNLTLSNQSLWAIDSCVRGQLVVVGARIQSAKSGPIIQTVNNGDPFDGNLALIDSQVTYAAPGSANTLISAGRSFYLANTYLQNSASVLGSSLYPVASSGWTRVRELAHHIDPPNRGTPVAPTSQAVWVDGVRTGDSLFVAEPASAPPHDLQSRHDWGANFPSFDRPGVVNVRDFGAIGNNLTDDTAAFQAAIAAADTVFVPKGVYKIRDTLALRPGTRLIGLHHVLSQLIGHDNASNGRFGGSLAPEGRPMIETPNDPAATTTVAFLGVHINSNWAMHSPTAVGIYALRWQSGPASMARMVDVTPKHLTFWNVWTVWKNLGYTDAQISEARSTTLNPKAPRAVHPYDAFPGDAAPLNHSLVQVVNNGGGRWWNFWCHGYFGYDNDTRYLLLNGTSHRFQVYGLHGQHSDADTIFEIRDSQHVDIYGVKSEFHGRFLDLIGSRHVRIYGGAGAFGPGYDVNENIQTFYRVVDSSDWLIAAFSHQMRTGSGDTLQWEDPGTRRFPLVALNWSTYSPIWDTSGATRFDLPSAERPVLYKRGNPHVDYTSDVTLLAEDFDGSSPAATWSKTGNATFGTVADSNTGPAQGAPDLAMRLAPGSTYAGLIGDFPGQHALAVGDTLMFAADLRFEQAPDNTNYAYQLGLYADGADRGYLLMLNPVSGAWIVRKETGTTSTIGVGSDRVNVPVAGTRANSTAFGTTTRECVFSITRVSATRLEFGFWVDGVNLVTGAPPADTSGIYTDFGRVLLMNANQNKPFRIDNVEARVTRE